MPVGPLINTAAIFFGAIIGALLGKYVPEILKEKLPITFGLIAFSIGVPMIVGMTDSLVVVVSLLLSVMVGEVLRLEKQVEKVAWKFNNVVQKVVKSSDEQKSDNFMTQFISVLVLFSASGFGIIAALNEGISGDPAMLIVKSVLDFFTAIIFGTSLGYIVVISVVPQTIILVALFYLGSVILPLTTPDMLANFQALGGMIMLATGFSIMEIKNFSMINMLPGLLIVMPLYALLH